MDKLKGTEKIGIIAKPQERARKVVRELLEFLAKKEKEAFLDMDTARVAGVKNGRHRGEIPELVDFIIVLGGDGTLLSVARLILGRECPILGVNLGSLGFLTEVTLDEMFDLLEKIFGGDYKIQTRSMLYSETFRGDKVIDASHVLNDIVVNKGALARMIELEVFVHGRYVSDFRADGLIVSTPTGSTAYSLAAGGPILYPTMNAVIVNPICPHTLTLRPLVIPGDSVLEIHLKSKHQEEVFLTLDGQTGIPMRWKDMIRVSPGDQKIYLVQSTEKNYFNVLRKKLTWGGKIIERKTDGP